MAKDRKKLQHIHSSIPDKQPTAASLEVAEIAVNNAADKEFLSIKNTNDKVVRFSSDGQIIEWIERKEVMPYVGYVRGAAGPSATSGDTPTADGYGSYGIENTDLLNNKSELVFKLNQVAADLTTKHDKVNGKKDMYNKDVNPTTDGGINDGAGFFIDMSRYAMQDANPQFSSTTNTCRTTLSGTTIIRGLDGSCGSLLDIKVNSATTEVKTATTKVTSAHTTVGSATTIVSGDTSLFVSGTTTEIKKGNVIENHSGTTTETKVGAVVENHSGTTTENFVGNFSGNTSGTTTEIKIGAVNEYHSGTTQETKKGDVTETNLANKVENTSGTSTSNIVVDNIVNVSGETHITTTGNTAIHTEARLGLTAKDDILESSESSITITANIDVCETAGGKASFYGVAQTNLGLDCADSTPSVVTNLYGDTINADADTANTTVGTAITQVTSANTNINTATTVIGTSDTKITSAKTVINTANTSATTATLSGNTLQIRESGYIDYSGNTLTSYTASKTCIQANTDLNMGGNANTRIGYNCAGTSGYSDNVLVSASSSANTYAPNVVISGTNLDIKENVTKISSCSKIEIETNDLSISTCTGGTAEFNFCSGFTLNSDRIKMQECTNGSGSIMIQETDTTISGTNLSVNESGDTTFNVGDDFSVNASGDTTVLTSGNTTFITSGETKIITEDGTTIQNTAGDININTSGTTKITSTDNICAVADKTGAFKGTVKTNIGKDCSDAGQTAELNINGDTINESGNNITEISSEKTCIHAGTDLNMGGDNNTRVGYDCNGGSGYTNNTYISASNSAFTYSPNIAISGSNLDISGATTIDISGGTITEVSTGKTCIHAGSDLNMGGDTNTRLGYNCEGNSGYTNNTYISASSSAITYAPNIQISGNTTEITGTSNVYVYGNDICISGVTDASLGAQTVRVGTDCGTNVVATGITAISTNNITLSSATINESGTTEVNIYGGNNVNITSKDVCISGGTDASLGAKTVKIGTDCGTNTIATGVTINATTSVTVNAPTTIITGDTYISGDTTIGDTLNVSGVTTIGDTLIIKKGLEKKLEWSYGNVKTATGCAVDGSTNFSGDTCFVIPRDNNDINRRKVSWSYGNVKSASGSSYEPGQASDGSFVIPQCVGDINRRTLSWTYGSVTNASNSSYDPGASCDNTDSGNNIVIPKTVSDVTNGTVTLDTCLNVNTDICVTGKVSASNGFFQTSDRNAKENIEKPSDEKFVSARNTPIFKFNYKDDEEHRDIYGVIAQDAEANGLNEVVYTDENGKKAVDYTSLMILKIGYLEHDNAILRQQLAELYERVKKLEENK